METNQHFLRLHCSKDVGVTVLQIGLEFSDSDGTAHA